MDKIVQEKFFYYLISVLLLIIGLSGINRLFTKADLPFTYSFQNSRLISGDNSDGILQNDKILSIDGIIINSMYQLEIYLDGKSIGQDTDLVIQSSGETFSKIHIHLSRFYRNLNFILISLLVGLSFWITSVFLINKKYDNTPAKVLFWVLILFSVATMTSPGKYFHGNDIIAYIVRAFHVSTYFLGVIVFFHFTMIFPRKRNKNLNIYITILYVVSSLFCIILSGLQIISINNNTSEWVFVMESLWGKTEFIMLFLIILGTLNLYLYCRKLSDRSERKKIEWVFWGMAVGVFPFQLLWLLPRLLGFKEIIAEEFLLAFMILVPVFFAMAVIKHHVFEINVFVKKSILYTCLSFITILIYFTSLSALTIFANDLFKENSVIVSILLILLIAYIFNPLQIRIRNFIDRTFYRENYNFEKNIKAFSEGISEQNTVSGLSKYVINGINRILPVKKIALVATSEPDEKLIILSHQNFGDLNEFLTIIDFKKILAEPVLFIQKNKSEPGIESDQSLSEDMKKQGIDIVIPFIPEPKDTFGALILGEKKSELVYTKKDLEILNVLLLNVSVSFKKLQLQKKLLLEETEKFRLEELNKKMSYYVSSVSHDLKTPLTSIKIFTELLKDQDQTKKENTSEYINIIEGESDRLARLINNVLNFAKIENRIKEYSFSKTDLKECIEEVLKILKYQFEIDKFIIEKSLQENVYINADKDSVKEVLINIITNSIKYSLKKKFISITTSVENNFAIVNIKDEGIGISSQDIENIFKPFVRSKNSDTVHIGGAGIGLSIVRNIMNAHKGDVKVDSIPGKGSTFSLYFPLVGLKS